MKKYVKPALYYENFELTQHIVGGCDIITTSTMSVSVDNGCKVQSGVLEAFDGVDLANGFLDNDKDCDMQISLDGYCYYSNVFPLPLHTS